MTIPGLMPINSELPWLSDTQISNQTTKLQPGKPKEVIQTLPHNQAEGQNILLDGLKDFARKWELTNNKQIDLERSIPAPLRDVFTLQKEYNRMHLQAQLLEKITETFQASLRSLQKAAGA